MNGLNLLPKLACATLVAAAIGLVGTSPVAAGNYHSHCHYKTIITYEYETQPIVEWVTKYDHCGRAYAVKVVRQVTVKVPVERLVKDCH